MPVFTKRCHVFCIVFFDFIVGINSFWPVNLPYHASLYRWIVKNTMPFFFIILVSGFNKCGSQDAIYIFVFGSSQDVHDETGIFRTLPCIKDGIYVCVNFIWKWMQIIFHARSAMIVGIMCPHGQRIQTFGKWTDFSGIMGTLNVFLIFPMLNSSLLWRKFSRIWGSSTQNSFACRLLSSPDTCWDCLFIRRWTVFLFACIKNVSIISHAW